MTINRRQLALPALAIAPGLAVGLLGVIPAFAASADEDAVAKNVEAFRAAQVAADAKALEQATAFLKQAKDPSGFTAAAAASKLAIHATGDFSRADNSVPTIGEFHEAVQAASLLPKVPALIGRPLALGGNAYVFELTSRTAPSDDQWKQAKGAFIDQLIKQRQAQAWESFIQDLRARARK